MKSLIIRFMVLAGAVTLISAPLAYAVSPANQVAINGGLAYLKTQQASDGHINGFDGVTPWAAMAFSAGGSSLNTIATSGGTDLRAYLAANPPGASARATDWEKAILAITADHQNPYDFGGVNYVSNLRGFASGGQIGSATAVNDDVFGVLALAAARDSSSDTVLTGGVNFVLSHQLPDGGFNADTTATASDVDDSAAAIMALQAAENIGAGGSSVGAAITSALSYIAVMKNADGGYPYDSNFGALSDVSTTSWVVMAFTAAGNFDSADSAAAQAYILGTQQPDGSFPYQLPLFDPAGSGDTFNSAYAIPALAGATWPQSVFDGVIPGAGESTASPAPSPSISPSPNPSPTTTASPSPTPESGSVLGDSTSTNGGTGGSVLGDSALPVVGTVSNVVLLGLAFAIAVIAGAVVRLRQIRIRH